MIWEYFIGTIAAGLFLLMVSMWLALPMGWILASIIYKRSISYLKFTSGFIIMGFITNCLLGLIANTSSNQKSMAGIFLLSVVQYLPVFFLSAELSKREEGGEAIESNQKYEYIKKLYNPEFKDIDSYPDLNNKIDGDSDDIKPNA